MDLHFTKEKSIYRKAKVSFASDFSEREFEVVSHYKEYFLQNNTMGMLGIYFLPLASIDMAPIKDDMVGHKNKCDSRTKYLTYGQKYGRCQKIKTK